jgi:DNA-binding beta-propeller fold protein YncE
MQPAARGRRASTRWCGGRGRLVGAAAGILISGGFLLANARAATSVRGVSGDRWADVVIGQPEFGQITPNEVTARRLFNPGGVIVDRSVRPARVYVYDGGNSRVLGLSHLGHVAGGSDAGAPCTSDSDAPGSFCVIEQGRGADLVLGQPDFNHSGCNGDGNFQSYPLRAPASAATLCSMPVDQVSPLEGGSFANMAVDSVTGDLYVPDFDNARVLLYRSPFTTDTVADHVWGQADFAGNECNRGRGVGAPDAESLCFRSPSNEGFVAGVGLDADGNLWVADNQNNRVLRFPFDASTGHAGNVADLVLGQPDFTSWTPGSSLDRMHAPAAVRIDSSGSVYVADSLNGRVLVFDPPLSSGMAATRTLGSGFRIPTGLEFDPGTGGLWVSDRSTNQLLLFVNGRVTKVLFKDVEDNGGHCGGAYTGDGGNFFSPGDNAFVASYNICDSAGSIGIDADGNVLAAGSSFIQDVWRFPAPFPDPQLGIAHSADARLFPPYQFATHNAIGLGGIYSARGVAVARNQLIVADSGRLLFYNNPDDLRSGQPADGLVGAPNPRVDFPPFFGRIRNDGRGRLWAIRGDQVLVYRLPLTTGAQPIAVLRPPIPVLGGGRLSWSDSLAIGGIAPNRRGTALWLADPRRHRVFRIRNPLTDPVVDIVLGQQDLAGTECNQGRGVGAPSRDSLCQPGAVVLDPHGNVWVSDFALEVEGNRRLLEYDARLFRQHSHTARFGIPATRVFGSGGSFTGPSCQDALCGPWEPAFGPRGRMVVGVNGIIGSRFPLVYDNPLKSDHPDGTLNDFGSMPYAATFDSRGDLYVADLNRDRVLIYHRPFGGDSTRDSVPMIRSLGKSRSSEGFLFRQRGRRLAGSNTSRYICCTRRVGSGRGRRALPTR